MVITAVCKSGGNKALGIVSVLLLRLSIFSTSTVTSVYGCQLDSCVNDACSGATSLTYGFVAEGNTLGATVDVGVGACGFAGGTVSPGAWYTVMGNGNTVWASTCHSSSESDFDTQLSVFRGGCDALECVNGNDDSCGVHSEVSWETEPSQMYYILVHGATALDAGMFSLLVEEGTPSNDRCSGAVSLEVGSVVSASTNMATIDATTTTTPFCSSSDDDADADATASVAPGVWFTVTGNGKPLTAHTCDPSTDYDTYITVFTGASCDALSCEVGNDDYLHCGWSSLVSWDTTRGTTYYILVHGSNTAANAVGNFVLTVSESTSPQNDVCNGAIALTVGRTYTSSTIMATIDDDVPDSPTCGDSVIHGIAPGVWFTVKGTGNTFYASVCNDGTHFDTQISVFSGSCDALACEGGNNDYCDKQSTVMWETKTSVRYYILVHGYYRNAGPFSITADEAKVPQNNICDDSKLLQLGMEEGGFTSFAFPDDDFAVCGEASVSDAPGIWYSVKGTGTALLANACGSSYDTQMIVYSGSCEVLECVFGNDDGANCGAGSSASQVSWKSERDTRYYIYIYGYDRFDFGWYSLVVDEATAVPTNDECVGATPVALDVQMMGTLTDATVDNELQTCPDAPNDGPGVWYSVVATGGAMIADACGGSTFGGTASMGTTANNTAATGPAIRLRHMQVSVFVGSCSGLTCVATSAYACRVGWDSIPDATYSILVHTSNNNNNRNGDHQLTVMNAFPNDVCSGAIEISPGIPVMGNNQLASTDMDFGTCAMSTNNGGAGIWYSVVGTSGGALSATTCWNETDSSALLDTQVTVFSGSCENLMCINGTDDTCGLQSQVVWESSPGVVYYLLVSGFDQRALGDFTLLVESEVSESNDLCTGATPVTLGMLMTGSTEEATADSVRTCDRASSSSAPGVWFTMVGTGNAIVATSCGSDFDTQISVFTGTCDDPECAAGNDDSCGVQSTARWSSVLGVRYYILLHGYSFAVGNYTLAVEEVIVPASDLCINAVEVTVDDQVSGSTDLATAEEDLPSCDDVGGSVTAGVWYVIEGTGGTLEADLCESNFDTQISIYTGTCDDLICEAGNDDSCGFQSSVTWASQEGIMYYIFVHGYGITTGTYTLQLSEPEEDESTTEGEANGGRERRGRLLLVDETE